jgi:ubiquinone/menaquinone biosynthesis C-methylase UbiE
VTFREGDVRALNFAEGVFDAAMLVPASPMCRGPDQALRELFRVLKAGDSLAVFDGDYASTTLACADHDPVQTCADATMTALVHDRWLTHRLPWLRASRSSASTAMPTSRPSRLDRFRQPDRPQAVLTLKSVGRP